MQLHTLHQQRWQARPSARSVLLTLLGEYVYPTGEAVLSRTFVAGLAALGFEAPTTRQALARSAVAGWLARRRCGRETAWSLTEEARSILAAGTERIYGFGRRHRPWNGEWLLLLVTLPARSRQLRHRLATRLTWAGFGSLGQGLWISPDLSQQEELAEILRSLGLHRHATSFRCRPGDLGGTESLVARAWDLNAIALNHQSFLEEVDGSRPTTPRASFVALTRLVHRWRSLPFVDPDLPRGLLPSGWIGERAAGRFHQLHERWSRAAQQWWGEQGEARQDSG